MEIRVSSKTICSANVLKVEFGTNCPRGGDAGHGGRTIFRLLGMAGTQCTVRVGGKEVGDLTETLELDFGGDCECETFIKALKFACKVYGKPTHLR